MFVILLCVQAITVACRGPTSSASALCRGGLGDWGCGERGHGCGRVVRADLRDYVIVLLDSQRGLRYLDKARIHHKLDPVYGNTCLDGCERLLFISISLHTSAMLVEMITFLVPRSPVWKTRICSSIGSPACRASGIKRLALRGRLRNFSQRWLLRYVLLTLGAFQLEGQGRGLFLRDHLGTLEYHRGFAYRI